MRYLVYLCIICSFKQVAIGQSQGVTNSQTKLRPNQLRWSPTDATLDSVYIIRADTSTGEPGWYLVTLSGGGGVQDTTLAGDVVGGLNSTFVRKINGVTVENITPQNREVLTYNGTQWTPDSIALEDLPQMNASRVLGRGSSSAGAVTQLTPSNGVKISGNYIESDLTAGTGINISGTTTLTVSNSAPDQTVTISGATGTYPNFTVTPTAPGGSTTQVQYNNAGSFGALDSFTVSANPDRVGIGVPTPTARVDIQGSGATSATNALRVRNSAGTNLLTVVNNGYIGVGTNSPASSLDIQGGNTVDGLRIRLTGQNPYLAQFYNDAYSSSTAIFQYFGFNSGVFCMGSPSNNIVRLYTTGSGSSYTTPEIELQGNGNLKLMSNGGKIGINLTTPLAGIHNAINTTASTPSMLLSGTGYSGGTTTTTKPTFLIEPTGTTSTGWITSGTKLGVNAESGFSGNLLDLQVNGSSALSVQIASGSIANGLISGSFGVGSGKSFYWVGGGIIRSETVNNISLYNSTASDFGRLNFGGTTSSFPAIKRNGTGLDIRLADDSGYGAVQSLYDRFGSGSPESVVTAPVGAVYHRTDGGAGTSFYVKESGTGNTGWIAK